MKRSGFLVVAAVTTALFAASTASATTWTQDSSRCRSRLSKRAARVVRDVERGIGRCFKNSLKTGGAGANCYTTAGYDATGRVASAIAKLVANAAKCKNDGAQMVAEYGGVCPSPGTPATVANLVDLHTCIGRLSRDLTVNMYKDLMRNPANVNLSTTARKCSGKLFKGIAKYVDTSLKSTARCQVKIEKNDAGLAQNTNGYQCTDDDTKGKVSRALTKLFDVLPSGAKPSCTAADLAELGVAGVLEANFKARLASTGPLGIFTQNPIGLAHNLAEGLGQQHWEGGQCPVSTQLRLVSGFEGTTRVAGTRLDWGFTGSGHNFDLPSNFLGHVSLDFSADPTCSAGIISVSPFFEGNRCSQDNRERCDKPLLPDLASCGKACSLNPFRHCNVDNDCIDAGTDAGTCSATGLCLSRIGPPLALTVGGVPFCIDNLLESVTGTADAGTGASNTTVTQSSAVATGLQGRPCATCDGDATANDGVRDGTCNGGPDDGFPCDANTSAETFGPTSYDCLGSGFGVGGIFVSGGPRLSLSFTLSTGTDTLSAQPNSCGFGSIHDCHCAVCSGDDRVPCNTDTDCAAVGAGTCSSDGMGVSPRLPNDCVTDGFVCSEIASSNGLRGECASTMNFFCDGLTHPNGTGVLICRGGSCIANPFTICAADADCPMDDTCDTSAGDADCAILNPECGGDCGQCTLQSNRPCFLPDITVSGHPSQAQTTVAGNFCSPPLHLASSAGLFFNTRLGMPGPGRIAMDFELNPFCDSPPTKQFIGNGGNCNRP